MKNLLQASGGMMYGFVTATPLRELTKRKHNIIIANETHTAYTSTSEVDTHRAEPLVKEVGNIPLMKEVLSLNVAKYLIKAFL